MRLTTERQYGKKKRGPQLGDEKKAYLSWGQGQGTEINGAVKSRWLKEGGKKEVPGNGER